MTWPLVSPQSPAPHGSDFLRRGLTPSTEVRTSFPAPPLLFLLLPSGSVGLHNSQSYGGFSSCEWLKNSVLRIGVGYGGHSHLHHFCRRPPFPHGRSHPVDDSNFD
ncbi:hypothetical protein SLEP1_g41077 [Rubroshorea leprosula]|uniref:Uncharacterized protein n=1 Tax=Rubroshorea leprosula TaxID=152421 RepID=A0AAV5L5U0_9ROSI|nr:hypothetical protein SLEP1_g41077 [Rubroshorea leprosula]